MMEGRGNPQTPSLPRSNLALHQRFSHKESLFLQIKKEFRLKSLHLSEQNEPKHGVEMVRIFSLSLIFFFFFFKRKYNNRNKSIPLKI